MSNLSLGLSGCRLEKITDNTIRKYSKDEQYNERLLLQAIKQSYFQDFNFHNLQAPLIHEISQNQIYSFDMEYCNGKNYDQFFNYCSVNQTQKVLRILYDYFDFNISKSQTVESNDLKQKIILKLNSLSPKSDYKLIIDKIITDIDLINLDYVKHSFCHGDFTLANMLFTNNEVFLIDFLDSFVESYIVDLAKIKQDLFYHWVLKVNKTESMRLNQIFHYFWYKISERYHDIINSEAFILFDFLNLIRIEPYANEINRLILKECIEKHKYYVNFNCTNGRTIF